MAESDHLLLLDSEELQLVKSKHSEQNKLFFAVMLKFFQAEGRWPEQQDAISDLLIVSLSNQLNICLSQQLVNQYSN